METSRSTVSGKRSRWFCYTCF